MPHYYFNPSTGKNYYVPDKWVGPGFEIEKGLLGNACPF